MDFSDATFQTSSSLLVFNFIPDSKKALSEVCRVTKPGGCVSAAVWDYGAGMRMLRIFWDAAVTIDPAAGKFDESHMPLCRAGELEELWKQGGLEHVEERPLDIAMRFESLADYWDPIPSRPGAGRRLPAESRWRPPEGLARFGKPPISFAVGGHAFLMVRARLGGTRHRSRSPLMP